MTISEMLAAAATVPPFDPQAATRAYLDTLQGAARAKSDAYFEGGYWLPVWAAIVSVTVYWAMLRFGWVAKWSAWASRVTKRDWLKPALFSLPFVLASTLLTLPWSLYTGYFREHQYGMSNQTISGWLGEFGTALAVGLLFNAIFFAIIYGVIRNSPKRWWLWGSAAVGVLAAIMIMLGPVFIEPLFNKYTPMKDGPVKAEILHIAHEQEIPANDVFIVDASRQTKRISANVSGLGPTVRIALNDNLLNRSNMAGIKAVMGHEMGHYKLNHIASLLLYVVLMALAGFFTLWWAAPRILAKHGARWGVRDVADPASAALLSLIMAILAVPAGIIFNSVIRHHEIQADAFGLDAAREPDGFAMTAMQLSEYRKIEPSAVEELLFYDHPSGRSRVQMAMDWKAKHLAELPADQRGIVVMIPPPASAD